MKITSTLPALPFGPLGPSNPGWPIWPGGPLHIRYTKQQAVSLSPLWGWKSFNTFALSLTWKARKAAITCKRPILSSWFQFIEPDSFITHCWSLIFILYMCVYNPSPFCPSDPGSPEKKQPALWRASTKYQCPNDFMICANMPLGPGAPLSPFSEYASVSTRR